MPNGTCHLTRWALLHATDTLDATWDILEWRLSCADIHGITTESPGIRKCTQSRRYLYSQTGILYDLMMYDELMNETWLECPCW